MKNKIVRYQSKPITRAARMALVTLAIAGVLWAAKGGDASRRGHSLSLGAACSFGPAQHLGTAVNGPLFDGGPTVSTNEKTLIFAGTRDPVTEQEDLFISSRARRRDPWGTHGNLGSVVNDPVGDDASPRLSLDFRGDDG